ncbi:hypothetical protein C8J57DRAFT_1241654 [Mycena rebaudengoi]|nr:hypothetical protein C8J57DRAFT_1241654 [Mycena rebaudengoi]
MWDADIDALRRMACSACLTRFWWACAGVADNHRMDCAPLPFCACEAPQPGKTMCHTAPVPPAHQPPRCVAACYDIRAPAPHTGHPRELQLQDRHKAAHEHLLIRDTDLKLHARVLGVIVQPLDRAVHHCVLLRGQCVRLGGEEPVCGERRRERWERRAERGVQLLQCEAAAPEGVLQRVVALAGGLEVGKERTTSRTPTPARRAPISTPHGQEAGAQITHRTPPELRSPDQVALHSPPRPPTHPGAHLQLGPATVLVDVAPLLQPPRRLRKRQWIARCVGRPQPAHAHPKARAYAASSRICHSRRCLPTCIAISHQRIGKVHAR